MFHLDWLFDNADMSTKPTLVFWNSKPHEDTVRWISLAFFISGVDAELWHFTCTSKCGFAIPLSGISKGHNLYLFGWFLGCQCFCVEHIFFFKGQMSKVRVLLGPFCTPNQFTGGLCDVFSLPFLLWSHSVNVWPRNFLNGLQNYTPSRSVGRWAATQG